MDAKVVMDEDGMSGGSYHLDCMRWMDEAEWLACTSASVPCELPWILHGSQQTPSIQRSYHSTSSKVFNNLQVLQRCSTFQTYPGGNI